MDGPATGTSRCLRKTTCFCKIIWNSICSCSASTIATYELPTKWSYGHMVSNLCKSVAKGVHTLHKSNKNPLIYCLLSFQCHDFCWSKKTPFTQCHLKAATWRVNNGPFIKMNKIWIELDFSPTYRLSAGHHFPPHLLGRPHPLLSRTLRSQLCGQLRGSLLASLLLLCCLALAMLPGAVQPHCFWGC